MYLVKAKVIGGKIMSKSFKNYIHTYTQTQLEAEENRAESGNIY